MNPCGVKVINDWFNIKERGRPMGFFNAASTIGVAVSPPILAAMMLVMGWRDVYYHWCTGIFPPSAGICSIATAST